MRFKLDDSLFKNENIWGDIFSFLNRITKTRNHFIRISNPESNHFLRFKSNFPQISMLKITRRIDDDSKNFTTYFSEIYTVCNIDEHSIKKTKEILIDEALEMIRKPFLVYMENDRNDKNFLKFFCDSNQIIHINDLEKSGEIDYSSGGGVGELKRKIEAGAFNIERSYVFFDQDALPFGPPNRTSILISDHCLNKDIKHTMLKRRYIESYIPIRALGHYVNKQRNRKVLRVLLDKYSALGCESTKYFFNLKNGIVGDSKRYGNDVDITIKEHYSFIGKRDLKYFMNGFGDDVSNAYTYDIDMSLKMRDLAGWNEINLMVNNILRAV